MAEILKPSNLSLTWASGGDILDPGDTKYATGWQVEIPPRQWFNYLDNRQDEAIAHINQHGVAVWDSLTEYQADKSYVQGSDGDIYKALLTNINENPVTDISGNWQKIATLPLATALEAQTLTSTTTLLSPSLLADAFKGTNSSIGVSGFDIMPSGIIRQWGFSLVTAGSQVTVNLPITFPTAFLSLTSNVNANTLTATSFCNAFVVSTSQIKLSVNTGTGVGVYWQAVGY